MSDKINMSLSKPEVVAYASVSALFGIFLAAFLNDKKDKLHKSLRDTEEKTIGKQVNIVRKSTMSTHKNMLDLVKNPSFNNESLKSINLSAEGYVSQEMLMENDDAIELKKLIKRQKE